MATARRASRAAEAGQGVEGGEVLAVGDEALEDAAGEVVGVVHAGGVDLAGGVFQFVAESGRRPGAGSCWRMSLPMAKMGQ